MKNDDRDFVIVFEFITKTISVSEAKRALVKAIRITIQRIPAKSPRRAHLMDLLRKIVQNSIDIRELQQLATFNERVEQLRTRIRRGERIRKHVLWERLPERYKQRLKRGRR